MRGRKPGPDLECVHTPIFGKNQSMHTICVFSIRAPLCFLPALPGTVIPAFAGMTQKIFAEREDYQYGRNDTAEISMFTEPLSGKRCVSVRERRTAKDWAPEVNDLPENHYPEADYIRLVCDNLNTHKTASFCEAFPPEKAGKLINRLEIHHTPKHGSWLNIAEIELSAMTKQCLTRLRTSEHCGMKSGYGNRNAMRSRKVLTGSLPPKTHALNLNVFILYSNHKIKIDNAVVPIRKFSGIKNRIFPEKSGFSENFTPESLWSLA